MEHKDKYFIMCLESQYNALGVFLNEHLMF